MNRFLFLIFSALLSAAPVMPAAAEVVRRTANNGQVILEDVPDIPPALGEQLRRYQNVRSASVLDWSSSGRQLYIRTRFAEVDQIHYVAQAGGVRRQLTWFDEPVYEVVRQPKSELLALTRDIGGSEFTQIFLFDTAAGTSELISDGVSRNSQLVWSEDGSRLAFQSTRRDGRANDVWVMHTGDPATARLVVKAEDGAWWAPVAFDLSGEILLLQQYVSINEARVYLFNFASGRLTALLPDLHGPASDIAQAFAHDADGRARGVYFLTDRGGEFAQLAYQSFEPDAKWQALTAKIDWSVSEFALSPDGRRGAFVTNEDGLSRLYLFAPESAAYRRVEGVPDGVISGLKFNPAGDRLAFTLNNAQTPSDAYVLALSGGAVQAGMLERWTESEVGGLDTGRFALPELIHYPTFDKVDGRPRQIPAFVYRPPGPGPHPVIISIHGGPEGQARPVFSSTYQLWLAELGAAVVVPNVRGSSGYGKTYVALDNGFKREDAVRDIGALLDWIATQDDLDASRVALYGGSYGGYMVLAGAVHYSAKLKAAVDIVGISHFVTFLENTQDYRRDLRRVEYGDERDPKMRAHLEKISPLRNVERIRIPLFVAQGQNDPRVPVSESEQLVAALRAKGVPVWYMKAMNEGHGFRKKENQDLFGEVMMLFWQKYL